MKSKFVAESKRHFFLKSCYSYIILDNIAIRIMKNPVENNTKIILNGLIKPGTYTKPPLLYIKILLHVLEKKMIIRLIVFLVNATLLFCLDYRFFFLL